MFLPDEAVDAQQVDNAMELMAGQVAANTRPRDVTERAMQDRDRLKKWVAYRRKHEAVAEAIRDGVAGRKWKREVDWYEKLQWQRQGPDHGR